MRRSGFLWGILEGSEEEDGRGWDEKREGKVEVEAVKTKTA